MKVRTLSFAAAVAISVCISAPFDATPVSAATTTPLSVRWSATATGPISRPAVYGTTAYYTSGPVATAVDLNTGVIKWTHDFTDPQFGAPLLGAPTTDGTYVLMQISVAGAGGLTSLAAATGNYVSGGVSFHTFAGLMTIDGQLRAGSAGAYGSGTPRHCGFRRPHIFHLIRQWWNHTGLHDHGRSSVWRWKQHDLWP